MKDLFAFLGVPDFDEFAKYIAATTAAERYRYLSNFLSTRQPDEVTSGYQALATLCAQNYFDFVLTTNMDPLLSSQSPRVKIVKLHGDLFQRFMAWSAFAVWRNRPAARCGSHIHNRFPIISPGTRPCAL
jgi:NAD-dependent SIR2 family protein deacetylase